MPLERYYNLKASPFRAGGGQQWLWVFIANNMISMDIPRKNIFIHGYNLYEAAMNG
jgi:hypothetical protein